ncbi:uncharacterized protein LOC126906026 [Daktulosphaira vitifoliae]|uniref:uncharacterized protein LOC126906026 n=1 Tax=Daktulosphaira vitifoliae TaxID=58002 RepID=UPI0021AAEF63|nr:uncharacterized protein LOC126906026 [Daktulosphaira vitifoliae]
MFINKICTEILFCFLIFVSISQALFIFKVLKTIRCMKNRELELINTYINEPPPDTVPPNSFTIYQDVTHHMNLTLTLTTFTKKNKTWEYVRSLSGKTINFCTFVKYDVIMMPILRKFISFPHDCPLKKTSQIISRNQLEPMIRPVMYIGCWKLKIEYTDSRKNIRGCYNIICLQSTEAQLETDLKSCY